MTTASEPAPSPPFTQTREFWVLIAYALVLGVFGAFASLLFMGVVGFGDSWYTASDPSWFGGQWWWIAVTAGAGVAVGLLRQLTRLPETIPSLLADLKEQHVDAKLVPGIVVVSAVSLIGGASLGPEKPLGSLGGGAGSWLSRRRGLSEEDAQLNTLSGFAGAYGGLFSVTLGVVALIVEVANLGRDRYVKALLGTIVASSLSFGIYFAIAGSVFLDAYTVPPYEFESWQLLAGVPLGLLAAVLVTVLAVLVKLAAGLFGRLNTPGIVKSTLGGAVFGLVGVALPLTLFAGSEQLKTVVNDAGTLGLGLIVALVIANMFTFAVSQVSAFIAGPSSLPVHCGAAGVAVHEIFPGSAMGLVSLSVCCCSRNLPFSWESAPVLVCPARARS